MTCSSKYHHSSERVLTACIGMLLFFGIGANFTLGLIGGAMIGWVFYRENEIKKKRAFLEQELATIKFFQEEKPIYPRKAS
jgi:hypothetical protein